MSSILSLRSLLPLAAVIALSACSRGAGPEMYKGVHQMVNATTEEVTLDLDSPEAIGTLNQWMLNDVPSMAMLVCAPESIPCDEAIILLKSYRVPYTIESINSASNRILMMYDRITEAPCNKYAKGCTQALNAYIMINDPRTVVRPNPVDYPSAMRFIKK